MSTNIAPSAQDMLAHDFRTALSYLQKIASDIAPLLVVSAIEGGKPGDVPTITFDPHKASGKQALKNFLVQNKNRNIYYQLNSTKAAISSRMKKENVAFIRGITIDLDPMKGKDFTEEQKRLQAIAEDAGSGLDPVTPAFAVASGGGVQLIYLFHSPVEATEASIREVEDLNRKLASFYGADMAVANVASLVRLPGSVNWQRGSSKTGRPVVQARVLADTSARTDAFTLEGAIEALEEIGAQPTAKTDRPAKVKTANDNAPHDSKPARSKPAGKAMMRQLESALDHLEQTGLELIGEGFDWQDWCNFGMSLHHESCGSALGLAIFDRWSATSDRYHETCIGAGRKTTGRQRTAALWNSFKRTEGKVLTGATILKRAEDFGWTNNLKAKPVTGDSFGAVEDPEDEAPAGTSAIDRALMSPQERNAALKDYGSYLVQNFMHECSLIAIVAASNVGKSTIMMDLGFAVALGAPFFGKKTKRQGVIFVAAENPRNADMRLAAVRKKYLEQFEIPGCAFTVNPNEAPFLLWDDKVDFNDPAAFAKFRKQLKELRTRAEQRYGVPFGVIMIDTFSAASGDSSEMDDKQMKGIVRRLQQLRTDDRLTVLVSHHTAIDSDRPRGHSVFDSDFDAWYFAAPVALVTSRKEVFRDGTMKRLLVTEEQEILRPTDGTLPIRMVAKKSREVSKAGDGGVIRFKIGAVDIKDMVPGITFEEGDVTTQPIAVPCEVRSFGAVKDENDEADEATEEATTKGRSTAKAARYPAMTGRNAEVFAALQSLIDPLEAEIAPVTTGQVVAAYVALSGSPVNKRGRKLEAGEIVRKALNRIKDQHCVTSPKNGTWLSRSPAEAAEAAQREASTASYAAADDEV